MDHHNYWGTKW